MIKFHFKSIFAMFRLHILIFFDMIKIQFIEIM